MFSKNYHPAWLSVCASHPDETKQYSPRTITLMSYSFIYSHEQLLPLDHVNILKDLPKTLRYDLFSYRQLSSN